MGDHCQQLNTVMNNISANYSDDQIKQALGLLSVKIWLWNTVEKNGKDLNSNS